ncbi:hypothetical protein, partial [Salmonella enterica]|uniref:hypothetical protein n=1 Tax=Salmonella enterica TaxID=28901 RepID=UPI003D271940
TFHVARDYRLRVVSLSQFGVVFPANPDDGGPFVRVNGPAKVRLQTTVLFGDTNSPGWDQLQPAVPDQVVYGRYAYSRFSEL